MKANKLCLDQRTRMNAAHAFPSEVRHIAKPTFKIKLCLIKLTLTLSILISDCARPFLSYLG